MQTRWMIVSATTWFLATTCMGQGPVMSSFQGNGRLSWTNSVNSNALYRVEWAAQAGGPWFRSFDNIGSMDGRSAAGFTVAVPMFYRVVMATNQPPVGMVWIDHGDVELGQPGIATPVHTNYISGFWMDATEVTKAQWDDVATWAETNGYDITMAGGSGKTNNHPVQMVTWYECVKWCNARSQKEGLTPCFFTTPAQDTVYTTGIVDVATNGVNWMANGYRLPTEAEWEKASRGNRQGRLFPWGGDTIQHTRANYLSYWVSGTPYYLFDTSLTEGYHPNYQVGGVPYTSPVGSFPANGYGLHDMAGNVWEWCWDWYGQYDASYQTDPHGPALAELESSRITRWGAWGPDASDDRCGARNIDRPDHETNKLGFRSVRIP
jgi:formylglycine-generating enzyme